VWLHVDAAMAGSAAICPEFRFIHAGLEHADSYCFNPHKWLLVNHGCSCLFVANRQALISAMSILPEYLKNPATDSGQVIDYRDWQIPLGRPFRALKLWFVLRYYGLEGLQNHIRQHVQLAEQFAGWIEQSSCFALTVPRSLNLVCFHHVAGDAASERVLQEVNRSGDMFLSHTRLQGRYVLRMCVSQVHTNEQHVRAAFERLVAAAASGAAQ
jgi:aromatic-L-amino-acid decarboxylase